MKRIRIKRVGENPFVLDCIRIKAIFAKRGFDINQEQARELWEQFSESRSAGWLHPDKYGDDAIFKGLWPFWEEAPSDRSRRGAAFMSTYAEVKSNTDQK